MKAILSSLFFLMLLYETCTAQFYDKTWLVGSSTMVELTFDSSALDTASFYQSSALPIVLASSNISDTNGNLLFYCNGLQVGNQLGQIMENGDTLTDLLFYNYFGNGFTEPQTNIILPKSGNIFYLFYYSQSDSLFNTQTIDEPDRLYYAVIDMDANGGLGKVLSKKNILYQGLFGDCRLTACRHANGRDWWLVHQGYENDEYFIYLVTPDSVYSPQIQHIGYSNFQGDNLDGQSTFSLDGSKFATITVISSLEIMGFDRCTGLFSNPDSINIPIDSFYYNGTLDAITISGGGSTCFSPSGRFLYTSNSIDIVQYDTWAANVMASATLIGRWDSVGPVGGDYGFDLMYLLPNEQIIIDDVQGGGNAFHLIDSPDVKGVGCHFMFNGLPVNTLSAAALPNMINYRLGALAGSGCDTLTGINTLSASTCAIKVYPNPASDRIIIGLSTYLKDAQLSVYDALGAVVYQSPMYLDADLDVSGFACGVYLVRVSSKDGNVSGKFVKE